MKRRLITTADDLGISTAVNDAIIRAHREGVLRFASLMVSGPAVADAVGRVRRECPGLGIGLHLVLCSGNSALPAERLGGLVDADGRFPDDPVECGMRYFFCADLHRKLELEMRAQFELFLSLGLPPSHVDGHANIHVHPVVFPMLTRLAREYGFNRVRLPGGELMAGLRHGLKPLGKQLAEGLGFDLLRGYLLRCCDTSELQASHPVFGLLRSGLMKEDYVVSCLRRLPEGLTEMYFHPSADPKSAADDQPVSGHHTITELQTLISRRVREALVEEKVELISHEAFR